MAAAPTVATLEAALASLPDKPYAAFAPEEWQQVYALMERFQEHSGVNARVARRIGISHGALSKRFASKRDGSSKPGKRPLLPPTVETGLREWIVAKAEAMTPVTLKTLCMKAKEVAVLMDMPDKGIGTPDWARKFLGRHDDISRRVPETIDPHRLMAVNRPATDFYFAQLKAATDGVAPENIWTMDETAVLGAKEYKELVLAPKGFKHVNDTGSGTSSKHVSMVLAASAAGDVAPPMFIFEGVRSMTKYGNNAPSAWITTTPSGGMTAESMPEWLKKFFGFLKGRKDAPPGKIVLLYDNHSSHMTLEDAYAARTFPGLEIVIATLLPHTSHVCSPLDVAVFKPFKTALRALRSETPARDDNIANLCVRALVTSTKVTHNVDGTRTSNVISGFKQAGIYPLDLASIDEIHYTRSERVLEHKDATVAAEAARAGVPVPPVVAKYPAKEVQAAAIATALTVTVDMTERMASFFSRTEKKTSGCVILTGDELVAKMLDKEEAAKAAEEDKVERIAERAEKRAQKEAEAAAKREAREARQAERAAALAAKAAKPKKAKRVASAGAAATVLPPTEASSSSAAAAAASPSVHAAAGSKRRTETAPESISDEVTRVAVKTRTGRTATRV